MLYRFCWKTNVKNELWFFQWASTRLEYARWRKGCQWNGFPCCTTFSIVLVSMYLNKYCRKCWSKNLIDFSLKLFFFLSPLMYKDLYLEKFLLLIKSSKGDEVESVYYLFIIERKHYLNFIVAFLVVVLLLLFFFRI